MPICDSMMGFPQIIGSLLMAFSFLHNLDGGIAMIMANPNDSGAAVLDEMGRTLSKFWMDAITLTL